MFDGKLHDHLRLKSKIKQKQQQPQREKTKQQQQKKRQKKNLKTTKYKVNLCIHCILNVSTKAQGAEGAEEYFPSTYRFAWSSLISCCFELELVTVDLTRTACSTTQTNYLERIERERERERERKKTTKEATNKQSST